MGENVIRNFLFVKVWSFSSILAAILDFDHFGHFFQKSVGTVGFLGKFQSRTNIKRKVNTISLKGPDERRTKYDVLMQFVIKNGSVRGNGEKRVFLNNGHLAQSHI